MKNSSRLSSKIASYSVIATALLAGKSAASQIIYHDIRPDADLHYDSSPLSLDLNDDGKVDINFNMRKVFDSGYLVYVGLEASPEHGASVVLNPEFFGVAALDPNTKIGYKLNAPYSWGTSARMAYQYSSEFGFMQTTAGPWNYKQNQNRYVGFRILKGGHAYYGWIRCNVDFTLFQTKNAELIVKDYAYNATPDQLIRAGQKTTEDFTAEKNDVKENLQIDAIVYESGKLIHVKANDFLNGTITIYNLLGENIYDQRINGKEMSIDLCNQGAGIYVVNLETPQSSKSFKVALLH